MVEKRSYLKLTRKLVYRTIKLGFFFVEVIAKNKSIYIYILSGYNFLGIYTDF
jgi:hypothetical protein